MKRVLLLGILLSLVFCGKKEARKEFAVQSGSTAAHYDTVAVDSFSTGATSENIARKIRISSKMYQDSLKAIQEKMIAEKVLKNEAAEKEKAAAKQEEVQKKAEALKLKKEKAKSEVAIPASQNTTNP